MPSLSRHENINEYDSEATALYQNISGVNYFSYSGVTFRGFRQDEVRYNGLVGDPYTSFEVPDLFNVARVEVLKGPAGVLYGFAEPGGIRNYVTAKPTAQARRSVELNVGTYDDFSGRTALR